MHGSFAAVLCLFDQFNLFSGLHGPQFSDRTLYRGDLESVASQFVCEEYREVMRDPDFGYALVVQQF
jgi:hypothetical protein